MTKKRKIILNIFVSVSTQLITLIFGVLLPRIILVNWGSEYNGLISSISTIMQYLALLEAGIGTSTLQALYKSISEENNIETSVIVRSSQRYYHYVSIIYAFAILLISLVYPMILNTKIPYWEIFWVVFLQGCSGVINFAFRAAYQKLLIAEGKQYIISLIAFMANILTYIAKIVSVVIFNNILIMQFLGLLIMGIQTCLYAVYFQRKYSWINKDVETNLNLLENRSYYVTQQIAGLVFNSTDTLLLSVFCGLKVASVYTVYNLIYNALRMVITIMRSSTGFLLGQAYHKEKSYFTHIYKLYSAFQLMIGCSLVSTSLLIINPFIKLYTDGIQDISYYNYPAAILFSLNIFLDCARGASLAGANIAGKASETTWHYVLEAAINLGVSLLLVKQFGIVGVLFGTAISGIWRSTDSIVYFNKKVLKTSAKKELLYVFINLIAFIIFAAMGNIIELPITNYLHFLVWGVICVGVSLIVFIGIFIIFRRDSLLTLVQGQGKTFDLMAKIFDRKNGKR